SAGGRAGQRGRETADRDRETARRDEHAGRARFRRRGAAAGGACVAIARPDRPSRRSGGRSRPGAPASRSIAAGDQGRYPGGARSLAPACGGGGRRARQPHNRRRARGGGGRADRQRSTGWPQARLPVARVQSRGEHHLLQGLRHRDQPHRHRAQDGDRSTARAGAEHRVREMETGVARRGLMLVLSSPSGAGKTTIARRLREQDDGIEMSISHTTRPRRNGEENGKDYHFVDRGSVTRMRDRGEFLEWAVVFDNFYGTTRKPVEDALAAG